MDTIEIPEPLKNTWTFYQNSQFEYHYTWYTVAMSLINKYPNMKSRHVHTTDYLSVSCDEEGILRIKKLHCKNRTFFMRRFRCMEHLKNCFVIEDIVVDRNKQQAHTASYNINYLDYGRIIEQYKVYPHFKYKTCTRIIVQTQFQAYSFWKAQFARLFYAAQTQNVIELMGIKLRKIRDALPFEMLE